MSYLAEVLLIIATFVMAPFIAAAVAIVYVVCCVLVMLDNVSLGVASLYGMREQRSAAVPRRGRPRHLLAAWLLEPDGGAESSLGVKPYYELRDAILPLQRAAVALEEMPAPLPPKETDR